MKKWWSQIRNESGQVLPLVMVTLVVGSLLIVPSLNYVWTHVTAGVKLEEDVKALYAADAGIEDALWHLRATEPDEWDPDWFNPDKGLNLSDFNGMDVHTVITDEYYISGLAVGQHIDWLDITDTSSYDEDSGTYTYSLNITVVANPKQRNIPWMRIEFPEGGLSYMPYSQSGNITFKGDPLPEPTSSGDLLLIWGEIDNLNTKLIYIDGDPPTTYGMTLELEGPPPADGEGDLDTNVAIYVKNETKLICDTWPVVITATASNSRGRHATITSAVNVLTDPSPLIVVRSWQITH